MNYWAIVSIFIIIFITIYSIFFRPNIETLESGIEFVAPPNSSAQSTEFMRELMRIGSQGEENAKFDNVSTSYIK